MPSRESTEFVNSLFRGGAAGGPQQSREERANRESVDVRDVLEQGVNMVAEGFAFMHSALDVESSADGSEPTPELLPDALEDEYEALTEAFAEFANACADWLGEPVFAELPED